MVMIRTLSLPGRKPRLLSTTSAVLTASVEAIVDSQNTVSSVRWLRLPEVLQITGFGRTRMLEFLHMSKRDPRFLPSYQMGPHAHYRIRSDDLERWMERNRW